MSNGRSFRKFVHRLEGIGLLWEIEKRARAEHVTLRELYEGQGRAPSIYRARRSVYMWLISANGKGSNEVARLFDRAPSGVGKLIRDKEA
jgi:hypothetical protein